MTTVAIFKSISLRPNHCSDQRLLTRYHNLGARVSDCSKTKMVTSRHGQTEHTVTLTSNKRQPREPHRGLILRKRCFGNRRVTLSDASFTQPPLSAAYMMNTALGVQRLEGSPQSRASSYAQHFLSPKQPKGQRESRRRGNQLTESAGLIRWMRSPTKQKWPMCPELHVDQKPRPMVQQQDTEKNSDKH